MNRANTPPFWNEFGEYLYEIIFTFRAQNALKQGIAPEKIRLSCVLIKGAQSALALFMALVLRADYHNFAVSFNYLALVAHRLY